MQETAGYGVDRLYASLKVVVDEGTLNITSRSTATREMTKLQAVETGKMEPWEAKKLLGLAAKMARAGSDEVEHIVVTLRELGYLPLAITLAGLYVSVTPRLLGFPLYLLEWPQAG